MKTKRDAAAENWSLIGLKHLDLKKIEEEEQEVHENIKTSQLDFRAGWTACQAELEPLLKLAVEALEFYADSKTYKVSISGQSPIFDDADDYPKNAKYGIQARKALKAIRAAGLGGEE